jgi:hypothetical protein
MFSIPRDIDLHILLRLVRDEDVTAGQTWMVLEYCDRGCLQVGTWESSNVLCFHLYNCCKYQPQVPVNSVYVVFLIIMIP